MEEIAGSLQFCRARITRLDAGGFPKVGARNLYVTDQQINFQFTPDYEDAVTVEVKNGCGDVVFRYKQKRRLKGMDVNMGIAVPDPELTELMAGGDTIEVGGQTVGYKYPKLGTILDTENGVSVEGWAKAIVDGEQDADLPWFWWVFPRVKFDIGERHLREEPLENPFSGYAEDNENWFDGPANDWPEPPADRVAQWVRTDTIPDAAVGYQALAAS